MKTFVLDTNVLLLDPQAVLKFPENRVVIPVTVLEELDAKKHQRDELGANARAAVRLLADLKNVGEGNLHQGVQIDNGSVIRVQLELKTDLSPGLGLTVKGNRILMTAYLLHDQGERVVFVSKNFAARVKAEAMGLEAEDYENLKVSFEELHRGVREVEVTKSEIDHFFKDGSLRSETVNQLELRPNEFCLLRSSEQSSALGRWNGKDKRLQALVSAHPDVWGVKPLNIEQRCALDLLLRPEVQLVTLVGQAGTGKTLLALACGLRQCYDDVIYSKILVSRPIVPMGKDIGYLPGTKEEKLLHWMQPIYDNLEFVCGTTGGGTPSETLRWVMESEKLEMEAFTYIRGRSLPKLYFIIDEAQNLTPHELKTIISRAGAGTKVVLTGDPTQIDNPYLDKDSNGLTYTAGKFRSYDLYGHVFLEKTERSTLAALAAEVM
jgi:PhoH-like ATPase